ncbi:MAG: transposase [Anaerolineae bacterium]|nr:transposase [Anaerolineae bacterium]MCO5193025.1 transposase [Anaerolineae bacterium]MCO5205627.1 transposase [Anaerolineae bacterium]
MTKQRTASLLDPWLNDVDNANFGPLIGFANGLRNDYAAVSNGLSLSWSQGQVEGQVNRLKLIKRQMYGRADFDLLRLRVLYQPP